MTTENLSPVDRRAECLDQAVRVALPDTHYSKVTEAAQAFYDWVLKDAPAAP